MNTVLVNANKSSWTDAMNLCVVMGGTPVSNLSSYLVKSLKSLNDIWSGEYNIYLTDGTTESNTGTCIAG